MRSLNEALTPVCHHLPLGVTDSSTQAVTHSVLARRLWRRWEAGRGRFPGCALMSKGAQLQTSSPNSSLHVRYTSIKWFREKEKEETKIPPAHSVS